MQNAFFTGFQILVGQLGGVEQVIGGIFVTVIALAIWVIGWNRRQRAAKKPGMSSLPFIAMCFVIALIAIGGAAYGLGARSQSSVSTFQIWPDPYSPIQEVNKTFENREVILDGHAYYGCKFFNVTFVYNGTTPLQFNNNTVSGTIRYRSDNPSVEGAVIWMKGFDLLKDGVPLNFPVPNTGIVTAPAHNSMGDIQGNSGVVTQGQKGDNK